MCCSKGFPLDRTCVCARCVRFSAPAKVGARSISLERIGILFIHILSKFNSIQNAPYQPRA